MKIYKLKSNVTDFCSFIEDYPDGQESVMSQSVRCRWQPFSTGNRPVKLELRRNDLGRKNYQFDISGALSPFFVFSERAVKELGDILTSRGVILPVATESKKKRFFGYYPTNALKSCFNEIDSNYQEYPNGLMIERNVLIIDNITDDYLFSIEENISDVFVTEKFKKRVEDSGLLGFDFSSEVQTS